MASGDAIGYLKLLSVILGLIFIGAAVSQLFVSVPYLTHYSSRAMGYIPFNLQTVSWVVLAVGVVLVIVGVFASEMGKYFSYY